MPEPDLTNLRWFFDHLELRDKFAADLAKELCYRTEGWEITDFGGPVQMDVWWLVLRRGAWTVRFGVERGYSDGVVARRDDAADEDRRLRLTTDAEARVWLART